MLKRTPLFELHKQQGARLIDFGGWEMPVQYSSIVDEHLQVRSKAGIFDISHMGEIFISGKEALPFLNRLLTNDARKLAIGKGQYTLMCNENGGVVDDLYLYQIGLERYLLIVNSSRVDIDHEWILSQAKAFGGRDLQIDNRSDAFGAVAVQGPAVPSFIDEVIRAFDPSAGSKASQLIKNDIAAFTINGQEAWIARTGYSGEDGFEIVAPADEIGSVWNECLGKGAAAGIKPAGLGARDTLRTEMCYPLYGHELDEETSPIEAGLGFFVALDKTDFNGRTRLLEQKQNGPSKRCVAFKMEGKSAPPRPGYSIYLAGSPSAAGKVVSGTQSPSLSLGIGLGYLPPEFAKAGTKIEVEIRGTKYPAVVSAKPLYKKA
ncbi:MAG: glycine cleavage system aminomethyltransferase GcvT [Verrucomicrobiales bacterium]